MEYINLSGGNVAQGHDIAQIACVFCRGGISDIDAVYDEGLSYHPHCHKLSISNEIKTYQKKISLGTITLAESNRMSELESTLNLVRDSDKRPISNLAQLRKKKIPSVSRFGSSVFFSEERRLKVIEDQQKANEYSLLVSSMIEEDKMIGDIYNNTTISDGKPTNFQALEIASKTAIFTPPEKAHG